MNGTIDVVDFIENRKIGAFQVRIFILCLAVALTDGYDAQVMGYVMPAVAKAWHLVDRAAFGMIFSIGFAGLLIGSLVFGLLADRFGRRAMILLCTVVYAFFTFITVFAHSVDVLLVLRFMTGLGVGGAIPNIIALMVEYSPKRKRATMATLVQSGISIGSVVVGFIVAPMLPRIAWTGAFYIGSIAPLLLIPLLAFQLPESIRFLVVQKRPRAKIVAVLAKLDPAFQDDGNTDIVAAEHARTGVPLKHLFTEGRGALTLLLWLSFLLNVFVILSLVPWMPTLLTSIDFSLGHAAQIAAMYSIGGLCGALIFGALIDRFGAYRVLPLTYAIGAISVACIGMWGPSTALVVLCVFGAGLCGSGGQYGANSYAGSFYPTFIRSTGTGWALGIGRIGGAFGPLVLGGLLSLGWSLHSVQWFYGAVTLAAACAFAVLGLLARRPAYQQEAVLAGDAP